MSNDISREFRLNVVKWINTVRDSQKRGDILDEEDVKNAIIDTFLRILDWNVNDPSEVKKEARIDGKWADYALKIDGEIKVIIEAKAPNRSLDGSGSRGSYEKQAINYAYNQGISWAILTNGETWRLYNAYWKRQSKLAFETNIGSFPKELEKIVLLTKEKVREERLDEYFKGRSKRPHVDEEVTQVLLDARAKLTESIIELNEDFTTNELREGIQRMLDRLLFMKICEDRDIRKFGQLRSLVGMVESDPRDKTTLTYYLVTAFRQFRDVYDGELFDENVVDKLKVDNKTLMDVIETLYAYDFSTINVDVLGRIYEDYLANVLSKLEEGGLEWITDNRERKEHGQFYTPQYIVDYVVDNVGITRDSRILDPACGSGAFLIKAYDRVRREYLEDEKIEKGKKQNNSNNLLAYIPKEEITEINKRILTENLYGVDLNPEAVELTKINLWLRSIQKDTELNKLDNNIQCGNSLVSGFEEELRKYFDNPNELRSFNWEEEFPDVLNDGGFDVVIGNPPYVNVENLDDDIRKYLMSNYKTAIKRFDIYIGFIQKGIELLKNGGRLAFIIPYPFLNQNYAEKLREMILETCCIEQIVDLRKCKIFRDAMVRNCIIVIRKERNAKKRNRNNVKVVTQEKCIDVIDETTSMLHHIQQNLFSEFPKNMFRLEMNEKTIPIIQKVESDTIQLGSICYVNWGVRSGNVKKYVLTSRINDLCKKMLDGRDINRYKIEYPGKYLLYDKEKLYNPMFEELFESEKLIIKDIVGDNGIIATYDADKYYTEHTVSLCVPKCLIKNVVRGGFRVMAEDIAISKRYNLKYILAIMNSKLSTFYFKTKLGCSLHVYPNDIKSIPIKRATSEQQKPLIELADRMLSLNRELNEISDPEKIIEKYGGGLGVKFKKIVMDSDYQNIEMSGSSAKARKVGVEVDDDIVVVKINGGNILKYSERDNLKQQYIKLYLENINPEKLNENVGMIRDRLLNLKIPDYRNTEAIKKIVNEAINRRKQITGEIKEVDNKIDQLIYRLYDLTDEEIRVIDEGLN